MNNMKSHNGTWQYWILGNSNKDVFLRRLFLCLLQNLTAKNSWGGNGMKGGGGGGGDLFIEHNLVKVTYGAGVVN